MALPGSAANKRLRYAVQTIRTMAELDHTASTWQRLAAGRNAVLDFPYARAWAAGLGARQRLCVLTAGRSETMALAPLVSERGAAGWLTMLAAEMYEIMDFLYANDDAAAELARAIVNTGRPLDLKRISADSPIIAALESAYRGRGIIRLQATAGSPWIALDESWCEPEMRLEAGRRSDLRRAKRQAEKIGTVETAIVTPTPAQLPQLMKEAFQVEAAGWKGAHGTALETDPVRGAFFGAMRRLPAPTERCACACCVLRRSRPPCRSLWKAVAGSIYSVPAMMSSSPVVRQAYCLPRKAFATPRAAGCIPTNLTAMLSRGPRFGPNWRTDAAPCAPIRSARAAHWHCAWMAAASPCGNCGRG